MGGVDVKRSSKKTRLWPSARRKKPGPRRRARGKENESPNNRKREGVFHNPRSLVTLCERVVKKYKLFPEPKKFTPPETFSVIGGKPLRKRSEKPLPEKHKKTKTRRKGNRFTPKSLVELCEIVVEEYNLLPETEEVLLPSGHKSFLQKYKKSRKRSRSQSDTAENRPRGRPRKSAQTKPRDGTPVALHCEIKRPRGRPPKDPNAATFSVKYIFNEERATPNVRIKEELDIPAEEDPLQDEGDYTVVIKEEPFEDEEQGLTDAVPMVPDPQVTSHRLVIDASEQIPGPSRIKSPAAMTIVMDEYQIFANSIAEQLRALPPNRALLLQLDIQSMIDNEKQLLIHEN